MTDIEFTWEVVSEDAETQTFVVAYTRGESTIKLNLPAGKSEAEVEIIVKQYAPIREWRELGLLDETVTIAPNTEGQRVGEQPAA